MQLDDIEEIGFEDLESRFEEVFSSGSPELRQKLAHEGYLNQLSYLVYDMACGKVALEDYDFALHLVRQAERLLGSELLVEQEYVRYYQMEMYLRKSMIAEAFDIAKKCLELNDRLNAQDPSDIDPYNRKGLIYYSLFESSSEVEYWRLAIESLKSANGVKPQEVRWDLFFDLVFTSYPAVKNDLQSAELAQFEALYEASKDKTSGLSFAVVHALSELIGRETEKLNPHIVHYYESYLEDAFLAPNFESTYFEIQELVRFFEIEGRTHNRPAFIDKAISNLNRLLGKQDDKHFAERSIMDCMEMKARIFADLGETDLAQKTATDALSYALKNEANFAKDFGTQLRLAEFLRDLAKSGLVKNPPKPKLIKTHALGAREKGRGFYAGPALVLVDLALDEGDEGEAIYLLGQEFLLHELCMDHHVKDLLSSVGNKFPKLRAILSDFLDLDAQVRDNYYLDPSYKWDQVKTMTKSLVSEAWEAKKAELRARPGRSQS